MWKLGQLQRRATKIVYNINNLHYSERFFAFGIPSPQYRRLRSDIIQVFKMLHRVEYNDSSFLPIRHTLFKRS